MLLLFLLVGLFICIGFMEEGYCCSIPGDIFFNFGYMIGYNVFGFIIAAYVSYNTNRWFYEKK